MAGAVARSGVQPIGEEAERKLVVIHRLESCGARSLGIPPKFSAPAPPLHITLTPHDRPYVARTTLSFEPRDLSGMIVSTARILILGIVMDVIYQWLVLKT